MLNIFKLSEQIYYIYFEPTTNHIDYTELQFIHTDDKILLRDNDLHYRYINLYDNVLSFERYAIRYFFGEDAEIDIDSVFLFKLFKITV